MWRSMWIVVVSSIALGLPQAVEAQEARATTKAAKAAARAAEKAAAKEAAKAAAKAADDEVKDLAWPPALKGAKNGTVMLQGKDLLQTPESVATQLKEGKIVDFDVAKAPPRVELALHDNLGTNPAARRLWSSWGDIGVASDGRVYCAIGDHGGDQAGDARCFIYCWDPKDSTLKQVVDMNKVVPPREGQPAWSKVHAKIDEGPDGKIYFSCTLNDGNKAKDPKYGFNDEHLPGGQLYRYDPATGKTEVFANLPPRRCTATSLVDRERNIWWCNLEAGEGNALWGLNLLTKKPIYHGEDKSVGFNRAFALLNDGNILFNGEPTFNRLDPQTKKIAKTETEIPDSPGMRCATHQSKAGIVYGVSYKTNHLFSYDAKNDKLTMLGPSWLTGEYTADCELSPDERFVYYLPGAHGKAWQSGTPIIQYEIATNRRKVLAFLAPAFDNAHTYVPAGTYGIELSTEGDTLYVNFNGHPGDSLRPTKMKPIGFGLTSFAAIHIPKSER